MKNIEELINKVHNADCLEFLKEIPDNSIDSIVTDPPAGISFMGKHWDTFAVGNRGTECRKTGSGNDCASEGFAKDVHWDKSPEALIGFQNFIFEVFTEVYRVLKPGGHGLVWALPKTSHHTAMGLERAGFEIRDKILHLFGTGFPKSLNVSKSLDKYFGEDRKPVLDENGDQVWTSQKQGKKSMFDGGKERHATYPATYYDGWGTALKPAAEEWILIRKPISENAIAENVLKYGVGGINIDGCRVGIDEITAHGGGNNLDGRKYGNGKGIPSIEKGSNIHYGRFPSNVIHDGSEEVMAEFDKYGEKKSGTNCIRTKEGSFGEHGGLGKEGDVQTTYGDKGSVSRFFYCAKSSQQDRNEGLGDMDDKISGIKNTSGRSYKTKCRLCEKEIRYDGRENRCLCENPEEYYPEIKSKNHHPTVKSTSLMRYLCRLITPPNGIILDPFAGSGSTGKGALQEGFRFIGIEREIDYCEIANKRMWVKEVVDKKLRQKNKEIVNEDLRKGQQTIF